MTPDTNTASGAADKALAYLDALSDDAAAHIFPSDLAKCMASECVAEVFSVRAGNPNEKTVPLFSREQVVAALASAAAPAEQPNTAYAELPDDREAFKTYLKECDECAIVPDVAGAFNAAWQIASRGQAPADPDGEAFRTAAQLGLTLRFYGSCAQSSMPGTPSAYEVVDGADRAVAMREAVQLAAAAIENGGEPQRLGGPTAQPAPEPSVLEDAARYRWLREQSFDTWKLIAWNTWNNDPAVWPDRDAAIDAAMKKGANHD